MKRYMFCKLSLLLAMLALLNAAPHELTAQSEQQCFSETSECIDGRFLVYWLKNGGLPVFGYPISAAADEPDREDGQPRLSQWFQRTRFELHPELAAPYDVLLGRIGEDRLVQADRNWQSEPPEGGSQPDCNWFPETGHNVCNFKDGLGFKSYWESNSLLDPKLDNYQASLALFGYPLTEAREEVSATDGRTYLTQWFERARFEWHPDERDEYKVLLGLLGNEIRANTGPDLPQSQYCPDSPDRDPTIQVNFGDILQVDTPDGAQLVRVGAYINPELQQTFAITVTGRRQDALETYTNELRVCLAAEQPQRVSEPLPEAVEPTVVLRNQLLADPNTENLIIEFDIDDPAQQSDLPNGYALSFVIDPKINKGVTHDYEAKCRDSANAKIWMNNKQQAVGTVTGNLLRNGKSTGARKVTTYYTVNLPTLDPFHTTYDLTVRGDDAVNKYRVSGTWNRDYAAGAPSGGGVPCPK
jgi:hypothetical protein